MEGGESVGRYSFFGFDPAEVFRSRGRSCSIETKNGRESFEANPIEALRRRISRYKPVRVPGLPPLVGGAIGYFAYDMIRLMERIPSSGDDQLKLDDSVLMFFDGLIVFDRVQHRIWIVQNGSSRPSQMNTRVPSEVLPTTCCRCMGGAKLNAAKTSRNNTNCRIVTNTFFIKRKLLRIPS